MFIRPELRKGDIDLRIKAPKELVDKLDLISYALGVDRQAVALIALDAYTTELSHISKVLAPYAAKQRNRNGSREEANK